MARIGEATSETIQAIQERLKAQASDCDCLEEAAQELADAFYEAFQDTTVLARVFATIPFRDIPPDVKSFVKVMASGKGKGTTLREETPILCLLGTRGSDPDWNNRRRSRGHLAIPLASPEFVEEIPMVARLLKELGLSLRWLDRDDPGVLTRTIGSITGTFYVEDAAGAVDHQGRKIIAAQDFVSSKGVKTVFGFGGGYMLQRSFVVMVVFSREAIPRELAERFAPLVNVLKAATMRMVIENRIFAH